MYICVEMLFARAIVCGVCELQWHNMKLTNEQEYREFYILFSFNLIFSYFSLSVHTCFNELTYTFLCTLAPVYFTSNVCTCTPHTRHTHTTHFAHLTDYIKTARFIETKTSRHHFCRCTFHSSVRSIC